jgi:chemotaxis-related protein WspD
MIVIGDGSGRWAIPVDEVHAMHRLPSSELQPAPVTLTKAPSAFSTGIFDLEGRSVALLDERLLLGAFGRALK